MDLNNVLSTSRVKTLEDKLIYIDTLILWL
nr:MAG TPA: hypothetical protein [Caudoviricetes sp.]DAU89565.1 MAG TPA: hypothetical protein [Caudoviricetes sp.]